MNARPVWQQQNEGGELRLALDIPAHHRALRTDPPLYLDTQGRRIGVLQVQGLNRRQLDLLDDAPAIPEALAESVSERMLQELPDLPIQPPRAQDVADLVGVVPVQHLTLYADQQIDWQVSYDGHHLRPLERVGVSMVRTEQGLLRVHRDRDKEEAAWQRLLEQGLQSADMGSGTSDALLLHPGQHLDEDELTRFWGGFLALAVPELEAEGWRIHRDQDFAHRVDIADDFALGVEQTENDWFLLSFDLQLEDARVALLPLVSSLIEEYGERLQGGGDHPEYIAVSLDRTRHVRVPMARLLPVVEHLVDLLDHRDLGEQQALRLSRMDAPRLNRLAESAPELAQQGGAELRRFGQRLRDFDGIQPVTPPAGLQAELRPYQQGGLNWLQFLREYGLGGVLADDMGLGKTLQTLAHLLVEKEAGRLDQPALIVAPTSLMTNWRREAERFTPGLSVLTLQGQQRKARFKDIGRHDIVLTTYPLLPRDGATLKKQHYHSLILDEAQMVKNAKSKAAQLLRALQADHRLCLTGTPMENHLGELWSQFDFLMPGFLGNAKRFTRTYRTPVEKHGDLERRALLQQRVAPFLLRRGKDQVASELPPKTEILRSASFDEAQAMLYESIRLTMEKRVRDAVAAKGLASSHITILDALLKLRQVCCDPRLLRGGQGVKVKQSAKLELLMQLLPELLEEGRRVLLFSQFTSMLKLIEERVGALGISYSKLTGQTRKREQAIERFTSGKVPLFLISLKAGGVGLNLTEADTVIHYDPWWNPAVEAQATDRAHRIGQDKPVFVYKLIAENTVEDKILAMQERKRALAAGVYGGQDGQDEPRFSAEDLQQLFELQLLQQ